MKLKIPAGRIGPGRDRWTGPSGLTRVGCWTGPSWADANRMPLLDWAGPLLNWAGLLDWTASWVAGRRTYSTRKTKKSTRLERKGETEEKGRGSRAMATGRGDSRLRRVSGSLLGRLS
ncbi:hypothetical protein CRG98_030035 [Punica granatum]|uniref:Uncharacterized protein n=1 Tax=Punica granatum TaxID=22663 RepID=A0A2I0J005_PUNGR|nr:hypothetical protein CRG98_030035 [Punica granatum]